MISYIETNHVSGRFFPATFSHSVSGNHKSGLPGNLIDLNRWAEFFSDSWELHRGYGATAARLTPDQKVGSSNLSALIFMSADCTFLSSSSNLSRLREEGARAASMGSILG